jgi:hypothetical protein
VAKVLLTRSILISIEGFFSNLRQVRGIATRCANDPRSLLAAVKLAAAGVRIRSLSAYDLILSDRAWVKESGSKAKCLHPLTLKTFTDPLRLSQ